MSSLTSKEHNQKVQDEALVPKSSVDSAVCHRSELTSQSFSSFNDDLVDWDASDDPSNPRNWNSRKKLCHVMLVSAFTFYSNIAAIIFAPGAQYLVKEFGIKDSMVASLTVSIYVLGYCVGPFLIAPLSEIYGRLVVYHVCNLVYEAFTVGCALSTNSSAFLVFRFLCGCAGAAPMAVGGGTIADLYMADERGKAMAIFSLGPLLGPAIGPVVGGFITQYSGWRWTFWVIFIMAGLISLISVIFMHETFEPILLKRKAVSLRKTTGNNRLRARTSDENAIQLKRLGQAVARPTKMLLFSPIILLISLYCALMFGLTYLLYTTFPTVFQDQYGWGPSLAGLAYLGLAVGMIISVGVIGAVSDKQVKEAKKPGSQMRPEIRLLLSVWTAPIVSVGFFWYGWSAQGDVHWIIPVLGTSVIGFGSFMILMPSQVYLVDAFGAETSASALAANTFMRSLFGAFLPLAGPPLYEALGLGWGNSLLAFISLVFVPVPFLFFKYGERLRGRFPVNY
ncbi:fluconazole resistance protein 1 [Colletotrichum incanum]|uniref:Fluconazole resistance protein 1 n=1 Tax=Colletotrichum incanum TaxID=1573173 RepID=A0A166WMD8_COLIC|nr:fluconazole resistance protein 1 [Colletotrichum incanum]OHX00279.1 fluconazole resistance protein 1 [Colletotrichum incanum]